MLLSVRPEQQAVTASVCTNTERSNDWTFNRRVEAGGDDTAADILDLLDFYWIFVARFLCVFLETSTRGHTRKQLYNCRFLMSTFNVS